jgi:hypothetical protein
MERNISLLFLVPTPSLHRGATNTDKFGGKTIIPTFYKLLKHKGIPNNLYKFVLKHHNKYMFIVSSLLPCVLMKFWRKLPEDDDNGETCKR